MELKKATRKQVKLRLGMSGASGFGKTYSALLLAFGMTNDWTKIAVIDTENDSAQLYSNLGEYNVIPLEAPYNPERYKQAIKICEDAGIEVIIIDSITHEWNGKGGCLDLHAEATKADKYHDSFKAWAKITPIHKDFIDTILQSKCHIITSVRRKQEYEITTDSDNKKKIIKLGTKEETREGLEYELTLNFEFVNENHYVKASKDRTGLFMDKPEFVITSETGKLIKQWCESGIDTEKENKETLQKELAVAISLAYSSKDTEELTKIWNKYPKFKENENFIAAVRETKSKFNTKTETK